MMVIVFWGCDRVRINESDIHVIVIIHPHFAKSPAASPEDIPSGPSKYQSSRSCAKVSALDEVWRFSQKTRSMAA